VSPAACHQFLTQFPPLLLLLLVLLLVPMAGCSTCPSTS
jgi:hypothetical protein